MLEVNLLAVVISELIPTDVISDEIPATVVRLELPTLAIVLNYLFQQHYSIYVC